MRCPYVGYRSSMLFALTLLCAEMQHRLHYNHMVAFPHMPHHEEARPVASITIRNLDDDVKTRLHVHDMVTDRLTQALARVVTGNGADDTVAGLGQVSRESGKDGPSAAPAASTTNGMALTRRAVCRRTRSSSGRSKILGNGDPVPAAVQASAPHEQSLGASEIDAVGRTRRALAARRTRETAARRLRYGTASAQPARTLRSEACDAFHLQIGLMEGLYRRKLVQQLQKPPVPGWRAQVASRHLREIASAGYRGSALRQHLPHPAALP